MLFVTAFITGLLGSFHCLGMCGPIALIAPSGISYTEFLGGRLFYNLGRIITYSLIGLVIGTFGYGLNVAGAQQYISVIAGIILLIIAIFKLAGWEKPKTQTFWGNYQIALQNRFGKLLTRPGMGAQFTVGLLNGLLPCGLVYIALAGAITTGNPWQGAGYMALFGLGTMPLMLSVSVAYKWVSKGVRNNIQRALPYFIACIAVLFIVRGLNLGIPYLSPKINSNSEMECCTKPE